MFRKWLISTYCNLICSPSFQDNPVAADFSGRFWHGHHAAAKHQSRVVLSLVSPRCCRLKPLVFSVKAHFPGPLLLLTVYRFLRTHSKFRQRFANGQLTIHSRRCSYVTHYEPSTKTLLAVYKRESSASQFLICIKHHPASRTCATPHLKLPEIPSGEGGSIWKCL
jgi:hypothetical protein